MSGVKWKASTHHHKSPLKRSTVSRLLRHRLDSKTGLKEIYHSLRADTTSSLHRLYKPPLMSCWLTRTCTRPCSQGTSTFLSPDWQGDRRSSWHVFVSVFLWVALWFPEPARDQSAVCNGLSPSSHVNIEAPLWAEVLFLILLDIIWNYNWFCVKHNIEVGFFFFIKTGIYNLVLFFYHVSANLVPFLPSHFFHLWHFFCICLEQIECESQKHVAFIRQPL